MRAGSFECSIDLLLGVLAGAKAAKVSFHFTFAFVTEMSKHLTFKAWFSVIFVRHKGLSGCLRIAEVVSCTVSSSRYPFLGAVHHLSMIRYVGVWYPKV